MSFGPADEVGCELGIFVGLSFVFDDLANFELEPDDFEGLSFNLDVLAMFSLVLDDFARFSLIVFNHSDTTFC